MIRTQIQLSEVQARQVRAAARRDGISMAEVIRRCIDDFLEGDEPARSELYRNARSVVGAFADRDRVTDLAERHDEYAFEDEQ